MTFIGLGFHDFLDYAKAVTAKQQIRTLLLQGKGSDLILLVHLRGLEPRTP